MKDITHYFSSPQKKLEDDPKCSVIAMENSTAPEQNQKKNKHKKKKKRKHSDPAVRDVTQLLSDNLKFSPNCIHAKKSICTNDSADIKTSITEISNASESVMKENKPVNTTKVEILKESKLNVTSNHDQSKTPSKEDDELEADIEAPDSSSVVKESEQKNKIEDSVIKSNKLNAFQFMMDRRNKSIGSNSPGKELDMSTCSDNPSNKEKLAARRDLFLNWSEEKGATKRKRLEEEKGEIIERKLNVRAKRLKKLLKVDVQTIPKENRTKRRKRIKKITSSSEDSDDDFEKKQVKEKVNIKKINKRRSSRVKDHENVIEYKKGFNKPEVMSNSSDTLKETVECDKKCAENDDLIVDKKDAYIKKRKRKSSLKAEPKHNSDLEEIKDIKPDLKKNNLKLKDDCKNDKRKQSVEEIKTEKKCKNDSNMEIKEHLEDSKPVKSKMGNILAFIQHKQSKDIVEVIDNSDCQVIEDEPIEHSQENSKGVTRKFRRKRNKSKSETIVIDESSQESEFTPRTLRSWKMKIKINADENGTDLESTVSRERKMVSYREDNSSDDNFFETSDASRISSDSEEVIKQSKATKKSVKIAPVFTKSTPKPKEDPAVVEARKQFLMSGIPASLKKVVDKQNSIIEQYTDTVQVTQHIQQRCTSSFWNLSKPDLKLFKFTPFEVDSELKCEHLTKSHIIRSINIDTEVKKVDKLKVLLNKIKAENPNYPVYKSFRQIHDKSGRKTNKLKEETKTPEKRKRGRKKKLNTSLEISSVQKTEIDPIEYAMWTEKYKPKSSNDIIGNAHAVKVLKKWLSDWKNFSQQINSRKMNGNSSESEFESTDCDSRDSSKLPGKIVVLGGPCGSGKSTTVYAICNELGFNVIELNASSKRTGKRLLQEIQEATQSHQVRKESQSFQNFFQSNSQTEKSETTEQPSQKKICVLLVEDIDIVFEQDDGFVSALLQVTATSKRPIVVTTTDYYSLNVQKFFGQYEFIQFSPLSSFSLSTWLQILFLIEGLYVSRDEIGSLLEYNKGDVRKTLLQLQFWVQSGGQLQTGKSIISLEHKRIDCDEQLIEDEPDDNSLMVQDFDEVNVFRHENCLGSFEILETEEPFKVPFYLNLDLIWWNITNILNIPNSSKQRINGVIDLEETSTSEHCKKDKEEILSISRVYDSLCYADVAFKNSDFYIAGDIINVKDSLELGEALVDDYKDMEFVHELTHTLVDGCIKNCATINDEECRLNITMPDKTERRWKTKLRICEAAFQEALLPTTERKSTTLDYMSTLRSITRSECSRAANNTKRGNRFRSYLRDLGIKCNEKIVNDACRILNH